MKCDTDINHNFFVHLHLYHVCVLVICVMLVMLVTLVMLGGETTSVFLPM